MRQTPGQKITEKQVVLLGAGNAHLKFLKRWSMAPMPGVAVTLVNEAGRIPYSAMVPAFLAGDYRWEEISMDLVKLCAKAGVRFTKEKVTGLSVDEKQVRFGARPPLRFDVLSLGIGSVPLHPANLSADDRTLLLRPLAELVKRVEALGARLETAERPFHLAVVGGGASGCELALALRKRFQRHSSLQITLFQAGPVILPTLPAKARGWLAHRLEACGVKVRRNAKVVGGEPGSLRLESGERVAYDAVLWATTGAPPPLVGLTGLQLDESGFLRVKETLQTETHPSVLGTGDCVSFRAYPKLPRNGVYAVREGDVLWKNVGNILFERSLERFIPQKRTLLLMNTADGEAVLSYGSLAWKGRGARKLKDRIDRAWMERFESIRPMGESSLEGEGQTEESRMMRCGGCGNKVSSDVLSAVLSRIEIKDDPRVVMGCRAAEDAAVFKAPPADCVEIQTVDYFKSFTDDPYIFGRIAALNALSDIYAMNAEPFSALAIATLPVARGPVQESILFELLSGAALTLKEAGVVLAGGHTTEGAELALGFSVTGHGRPDRLFLKGALRPGDKLVLTKPLGTGALLAAWMRGECDAVWLERLVSRMLLSNREAARVFASLGVQACTDVTGFGLAGHVLEMCDQSRCSVRIETARVPLHDGFSQVTGKGIVSTLQRGNAKVGVRILGQPPLPPWLFDPQTSGGLIAGVPPDRAADALKRLHDAGYPDAVIIGEAVLPHAGEPPGISLF